jgi:drug/metabolite transporter (DMT)-like permease
LFKFEKDIQLKIKKHINKTPVVVFLLALGMSIIPLNDALIKLLSDRFPLAEIVAIRAILCLLIVSFFGEGIREVIKLPLRVILLFSLRGMCLVIAMYLFFISLGSLPLSEVVSIFFVSPLLITLLSSIILKEKIGIHRIGSVVLALVGVILIMRPGTENFRPEMFLALGAALSYAIFQIFTRSLKSEGNLYALVTIQNFCYLISAMPLLLVNWLNPLEKTGNLSIDFLLRAPINPTFQDMIFIIICAFSVLMLSITSSHAYRTVEASLLAPFEYVAIPFSIFWGIVIFGDWPSNLSWIGMTLILFGGIYAIYRERVRGIEIISKVPMPASAAMYQKPNLENKSNE